MRGEPRGPFGRRPALRTPAGEKGDEAQRHRGHLRDEDPDEERSQRRERRPGDRHGEGGEDDRLAHGEAVHQQRPAAHLGRAARLGRCHHAGSEVAGDGPPDRVGRRDGERLAAERRQRLGAALRVGDGDDAPPAEGAPRHRLEFEAAGRVRLGDEGRIRRPRVEVDPPDPRLFRQRIGQGLGRDQPADEQDLPERGVLLPLLVQRRLQRRGGERAALHQNVAEIGLGRHDRRGGRGHRLEGKDQGHTDTPHLPDVET